MSSPIRSCNAYSQTLCNLLMKAKATKPCCGPALGRHQPVRQSENQLHQDILQLDTGHKLGSRKLAPLNACWVLEEYRGNCWPLWFWAFTNEANSAVWCWIACAKLVIGSPPPVTAPAFKAFSLQLVFLKVSGVPPLCVNFFSWSQAWQQSLGHEHWLLPWHKGLTYSFFLWVELCDDGQYLGLQHLIGWL